MSLLSCCCSRSAYILSGKYFLKYKTYNIIKVENTNVDDINNGLAQSNKIIYIYHQKIYMHRARPTPFANPIKSFGGGGGAA